MLRQQCVLNSISPAPGLGLPSSSSTSTGRRDCRHLLLWLCDATWCKMASASKAANLLCLAEKHFSKKPDKLSCHMWIRLLIYQHSLYVDPRKHSGCYLEYYKPSAICMLSSLHFNPITFQQIALDKRSHGQGICNAYKLTCSFNTRES